MKTRKKAMSKSDLEWHCAGLHDLLIKVKDFTVMGVLTDGGHHKQYCLMQILRAIDPEEHKKFLDGAVDKGIAP